MADFFPPPFQRPEGELEQTRQSMREDVGRSQHFEQLSDLEKAMLEKYFYAKMMGKIGTNKAWGAKRARDKLKPEDYLNQYEHNADTFRQLEWILPMATMAAGLAPRVVLGSRLAAEETGVNKAVARLAPTAAGGLWMQAGPMSQDQSREYHAEPQNWFDRRSADYLARNQSQEFMKDPEWRKKIEDYQYNQRNVMQPY